ncbi:hypothetical protein B0H15DRAFT_943886 [Mycena belliarum]|uniref:Uncharacterized protein n=1 Tax=Mycena belliarum TaxID=1033014 RepID=A0AAD6UFU8_9AGAR|nr:hypothetical protein B0H15DRAFT_943886 [Mycena belliae]
MAMLLIPSLSFLQLSHDSEPGVRALSDKSSLKFSAHLARAPARRHLEPSSVATVSDASGSNAALCIPRRPSARARWLGRPEAGPTCGIKLLFAAKAGSRKRPRSSAGTAQFS